MTRRTTKRRKPDTRKTVSTGGKGYRFKPTSEQRERVEILIAGGMSEEGIAAALGIDRSTLRKHFEVELRDGRSKKRAEVLEAMFRAATSGNVAAQKAFVQLNTVSAAEDEFLKDDARKPKARLPKVGKKEQAQLAAETAGEGSAWGDDLKLASGAIN